MGEDVKNRNSWYAVVIDLNDELICRPKNIVNAYSQLFKRLQKEKIVAVGVHLLGYTHGNIPLEEAIGIFTDCLKAEDCSFLKLIWLIVPEGDITSTRKHLMKKV